MASIKDKIKNIRRANITEIISRYISIEYCDGKYIGVCPFCDTPGKSLHINNSNGLFYCPECRAGGDAISFVQKLKGKNFVDAIKELEKNL